MNPGYRDDLHNDPHPGLVTAGLASEHRRNETKAISGVLDDGTRTPELIVCTLFQQF